MRRIIGFLFLFQLLVANEIHAQQLVLKTYDRSSGLASDYVLCMFQDRDGFIWFGTDRGVSKYDGREFRTYTQRDGLPDNFITAIFQDTEGYMWFGTYERGVARFDGTSFQVYSTKEGLRGNSVSKIIQDSKGKIYFLTNNGPSVLYRNSFSSFPVENKTLYMTMNDDGNVVLHSNKYLYTFLPCTDWNTFSLFSNTVSIRISISGSNSFKMMVVSIPDIFGSSISMRTIFGSLLGGILRKPSIAASPVA
ncbi:MAG: hypothetical protein HY960_14250 [Ignavibacteriae bacterium]|nr:hypothetical protein [Ignavibacteriota bacterium]